VQFESQKKRRGEETRVKFEVIPGDSSPKLMRGIKATDFRNI
jgi:hypothetical protein